MVMMVVMMVMHGRGKRRSGENHDQKHSSKNLFHGRNVARCELWKHERRPHESSEETICAIKREVVEGRKLETVKNLAETSPQPSHRRYFFEKFGITERLLERCLGEALSAGGDYADLYFESVTSTSLGVDEQIVKSASTGTSAGCGIRVISGERTGYAY